MFKKLFCILILTISLQGKVILWDLGGVLVWPDKLKMARIIGISNFLSYTLLDWKSPDIQAVIFEALELMEGPKPGMREKAGTSEGLPFPPIMYHWQDGTVTGPEIIRRSIPHLAKLDKLNFFESRRERELIERTIQAMFDPEILANSMYVLDKGLALVKECKQARDKDGKKHRNFIFSNFDPLSFDLLKKRLPGFFNLFDEIIISGHIGLIKPHAECYQYLIEKYNLDPKECILIDDQAVNVTCARKHGIGGVVLKKSNFKQLRKELVDLEILPSDKKK